MRFQTAAWASAALLCPSSGVTAQQECPVWSVLVYQDTVCGGTPTVAQLRNGSHDQIADFNSYRSGHVNNRFWDPHCAAFLLYLYDSANGTAATNVGLPQPFNGTDDYGPCINVLNANNGRGDNSFWSTCAAQGARGDCGENDGDYVPSGGVDGGGQPPTTTMPPTSTSDPPGGQPPVTVPPNTTPSPTDTSAPNPEIVDAISIAQDAIASASRSADALAADPTNSALAQAAEDAIFDAMAANTDAQNLASDYQSSEVSSDLDTLDNAILAAAVAAIAAAALLSLAAANELQNAFNDVQNAAQAAAATAANSNANPRPQRPRPTSSRNPPRACTISVGRADAALAEPTPSPEDLPANGALTKRALSDEGALYAAMEKALNLDFGDKVEDAEELATVFESISGIDIDVPGNKSSASLQKRAANRAAAYCRRSFQVPDYNSWSSTGPNNYSPFYNYYTDSGCADWRWLLRSGATQAALPAAPAGYLYPDNTFVTEHIFEIQQVARFLDYAKTNVPIFQQMFPDDQSFCTNFFGPFMASTTAFADPGVYDYTVPPIQQVYNSLEGGEGGSANEFVYLEAKVNSQKGFYFRGGAPSVPLSPTYQNRLAEATRTSVVAMYLNTAAVANIYREVSNRIVVAFTAFGVACNDTSARADYHQFGNVDWAGTYARWEQSYLNDIGSSMYVFARAQANFADDLIKDELRTQSRSRNNDRETKMRLNEIRSWIEYQLTRGDIQASKFTLPLLR